MSEKYEVVGRCVGKQHKRHTALYTAQSFGMALFYFSHHGRNVMAYRIASIIEDQLPPSNLPKAPGVSERSVALKLITEHSGSAFRLFTKPQFLSEIQLGRTIGRRPALHNNSSQEI
jgi:hypothetical protein